MTQPLDVLKTRQMNAKPGEFKVCCLMNKMNMHKRIFFLQKIFLIVLFNVPSIFAEYMASGTLYCKARSKWILQGICSSIHTSGTSYDFTIFVLGTTA